MVHCIGTSCMGQVGDISVKKGVLSTVTAALPYRRLEGDSADVLWISLKEKHAYRQKQVGRLGSTLFVFLEKCFDVLLPASSIQTSACVIKSSMHSLPIIHVSRPTAITTSSSPQWRWWSLQCDGQNRETIWEEMHALDVWRGRRVRVGNVALFMRLRPGCRSRANVSGQAADGVTYPRAARYILKPSPGCLRGARDGRKMHEATADGEEPILNGAGREEVRRGRVNSPK